MNVMRKQRHLQMAACCLIGMWLLVAAPALARSVTDSAGRTVEIPDSIHRVFAAGPPASTLLYILAPQDMIGWVRAPRDAEKPFLLQAVRELPELGRLTGRGDSLNLERLIAAKPDLVIDFGTINDTYRSLADRVQSQTGIPYLLIDAGAGRGRNLRASGQGHRQHSRREASARLSRAGRGRARDRLAGLDQH
jgi:iron complex transport system substrate-binding protein